MVRHLFDQFREKWTYKEGSCVVCGLPKEEMEVHVRVASLRGNKSYPVCSPDCFMKLPAPRES